MGKEKFTVIIEMDEDGYFVASVPQLPGCHTQARTMDELLNRMREAIVLYLESEGRLLKDIKTEFVGIQLIEVPVECA
ncbi:MAG: type II toxin-antitoxin system HicB family antitoxin [Candidatus Bathyarchaeia archaeon]